MEALTRLVSESFARHGFDRPLDYRRLKWSRWFRCESHHSLLFVPSKPGVFALAEEVTGVSDHAREATLSVVATPAHVATPVHVATAASAVPRSEASGFIPNAETRAPEAPQDSPKIRQASYQGAASAVPFNGNRRIAALAADAVHRADSPRMLAVAQFFEADDMAFVLDRMLSRYNPMRGRLESGRYFVRFVVIEDESQRRSIHAALNQWILSSAEKAGGIGGHFATSLELTAASGQVAPPDDSQQNLFSSAEMGRVIFSAHSSAQADAKQPAAAAPQRTSGAATNIQPCPFPSGF
jgi:hypothetical protein